MLKFLLGLKDGSTCLQPFCDSLLPVTNSVLSTCKETKKKIDIYIFCGFPVVILIAFGTSIVFALFTFFQMYSFAL